VFVAHHLAVDTISWPVVLGDLATLLRTRPGEPGMLAAPTCSIKQWADHLTAAAVSDDVRRELPIWTDATRRDVRPIPCDHSGANARDVEQEVSAFLEPEELAVLGSLNRRDGVSLEESLLSAIAGAVTRWTGDQRCLINVERHGREDLGAGLDVSRTVGFLPMLVPVSIEYPSGTAPRSAARSVHDQLAALPHHGIGHGLLRYLGQPDARTALRQLPAAEVFFCYHGELRVPGAAHAAGSRPSLDLGRSTGSTGLRRHLIEINAVVAHRRLSMSWTYSAAVHDSTTIERLANDSLAELRRSLNDSLAIG
jgi:non-ribosomal peptide synthase protein (TIGR01720 family)